MLVDLRSERLNRGLTVAQMAERAGVTKRVLQNAERGTTPHPANALKIATFLERQVTDIWPVHEAAA